MRGSMLKMFKKGMQVVFVTGPRGFRSDVGTIIKLHNSGKRGSAEIRTNGAVGLASKVTRSLRYVKRGDVK